jgi:hypothetical protein
MPCYQMIRRRAKQKLGVNLPPAALTDEEVQKELGETSHEELHAKVDAMSDEEFKRLVEYLQWKIKRRRMVSKEETNETPKTSEKEEEALPYIG